MSGIWDVINKLNDHGRVLEEVDRRLNEMQQEIDRLKGGAYGLGTTEIDDSATRKRIPRKYNRRSSNSTSE